MNEASKIVLLSNDWMTYLLVSVFVLIAALKYINSEKLLYSTTFFLSNKYVQIYYSKEKYSLVNVFQSLMFLAQIVVLSFAILITYQGLQLGENPVSFSFFITVAIGVSAYFSIRYLIGLFLSYIFNLGEAHNRLMHYKICYFNNFTLWVFPLIIVAIYIPFYRDLVFKIVGVLVLILLAVRYILVLINNKKLIFSDLFYFILYLCTLEIAPLLIILKLAK